jgi:hypothetical protein
MVKKISLLVVVLTIFFLSNINAQVKTVDSLVHRAFNSIRNQDEKAYVKLFPTFIQIKGFFNGLVNSVSDSTKKAALTLAFDQVNEEVYNSEINTKKVRSFHDFISKGLMNGIHWSKVQLDSFTVAENEHDIDMKSMHGKLYISEQGNQYVVPFSDVIWIKEEHGWFGFEMNRILKKAEEDVDDIIRWDEMVTFSDTAANGNAKPAEIQRQSDKKPVNKKPVAKKQETKPAAKKPKTSTNPKN